MSRSLLSALIAALIGLIWIGFLQYRKLNDNLIDATVRLATVERQLDAANQQQAAHAELGQRLEALESRVSEVEANPRPDRSASQTAPTAKAKPIVVRRFTNQTNGKSVEARLTAVDGPNVTIRRIDGKEFTFPIARLTRADQIYIAEHADALAAEPKADVTSDRNPSTQLKEIDFDSLFD